MTEEHIRQTRHALLDLHKLLIDTERQAWERTHGRTQPAEFLRVLMSDPSFAWLQPMTALIVRIDEWLDEDERDPAVATTWVDELGKLLAPSPALHAFHERYAALLQDHPDVVFAHRAVTRALASA